MVDVRLPLAEELLAAIDEARGDVPRTKWIRRAVEAALAKQQPDTPASVERKVKRAREVMEKGGYPAREEPKPLPRVDLGPAPGARSRLGHPFKAGKSPLRCEECGRKLGEH